MLKAFQVLLIMLVAQFSYAETSNTVMLPPSPSQERNVSPSGNEDLLKVQADDETIGNLNAPVVIIEYSSLGCPHCQRFHKDSFKAIKKDYIDTSKVLYVYRNFPTNRAALSASKLALCVGKDKFFTMLSALFESQSSWAYTDKFMDGLLNIAKLSGMTEEQFNKCQKDTALENKIISGAMKATNTLKIEGTPFFIINGEKIEGEKPTQFFKDIIEAKLSAANTNKALATKENTQPEHHN